MADDFDPCQCVCSTQWAMQRLLSILRQSQQHCTENECFPEAPGLERPPAENMDMLLMGFLWAMLVIVLFTTRPNSLRGQQKNSSNEDGNNPPPDVPPVQ